MPWSGVAPARTCARGDGARTSALGLGLSEVAARWSECTEGHMTEGAARPGGYRYCY